VLAQFGQRLLDAGELAQLEQPREPVELGKRLAKSS